MPLTLDDEPDLVVMSVYITSAKRAYRIADMYRQRGSHVALGGLHVTSLPDEAAAHADTVFVGPGEDTWPRFLDDLRRRSAGPPLRVADAVARRRPADPAGPHRPPPLPVPELDRRLARLPPPLRLLLQGRVLRGRHLVLHAGRRPGPRGDRRDARPPRLLPRRPPARQPALRSIAVRGHAGDGPRVPGGEHRRRRAPPGPPGARGRCRACEACSSASRRSTRPTSPLHAKRQNIARDYEGAIRRVHDLGIMVNGSFVFGLDDDRPDVFARTVDWAIAQGIETATFHIMTPYPGTALHDRIAAEGRITDTDWDHYDTRHVVYRPRHLSAEAAGRGLPAGLPRLLRLVVDPARSERPSDRSPAAATPRLCRRLEAVRAVLGPRHPGSARERDAAAARGDARRVRTCPPPWTRRSAGDRGVDD